MKALLTLFFGVCLQLAVGQFSATYTAKFMRLEETLQTTEVYAMPEEKADFWVLSAYTYAAENAPVHYRVKRHNSWSNWQALEHAHGTEGQARQAFEGVFIYEAFDSLQFGCYGPLSREVTFRLYLAGSNPTASPNNKTQNTLASCACAQPLVCLRNCWCPDGSCPKDNTPTPTNVTHLIVHHSAGGNNATDFAQVVQSYWDLHVNTNGWDDIGYNWLIDPNGVIYEGRGSGILGAHFSCMNQQTAGICMVGNFSALTPSDTAFASLKQLLAWESCDKNVVLTDTSVHPSSQLNLPHVSAHRDGNLSTAPNSCAVGTVCPGDSLYIRYWDRSVAPAAALACTDGVSLAEPTAAAFELFPNPAKAKLNIRLSQAFSPSPIQLRLMRMDGGVTLSSTLENIRGIYTVDLAQLPKGLYVVEVQQDQLLTRQVLLKE
jgi:hypothetical protein